MTKVAISGREWTFDPDRSDGGILVDRIDMDMPEYRPGKTYSADFVFFENTQDTVGIDETSGATVGGSYTDDSGTSQPSGFTLGGSYSDANGNTQATGATAGSMQGFGTQVERYEQVREYTRWAGRYAMTTAIDGTPRFSEHTPSDANHGVDSIVVKLEPGVNVKATDGLWVILDDVDDKTRFVEDTARISIRFTVLALGSRYATRADIKNDLGSDLA